MKTKLPLAVARQTAEAIKCACVHPDARECLERRLNPLNQPMDIDDVCECYCHDSCEDEEDFDT